MNSQEPRTGIPQATWGKIPKFTHPCRNQSRPTQHDAATAKYLTLTFKKIKYKLTSSRSLQSSHKDKPVWCGELQDTSVRGCATGSGRPHLREQPSPSPRPAAPQGKCILKWKKKNLIQLEESSCTGTQPQVQVTVGNTWLKKK